MSVEVQETPHCLVLPPSLPRYARPSLAQPRDITPLLALNLIEFNLTLPLPPPPPLSLSLCLPLSPPCALYTPPRTVHTSM